MRLEVDGGGGARTSRRDAHMTLSYRRARNRSLCSAICTPPPYPGFSAWMGNLSQLKLEDIDAAETEFVKGPPPEVLRSISTSYSPVSLLSVSLYDSPRVENGTILGDDEDFGQLVSGKKCNPSASSGYGSASSESDPEIHGDSPISTISDTETSQEFPGRYRCNRYRTLADREADKMRRRSVPASLRNAYSEDVLRVLELDGHIRFQTDVDSGERMPVIDIRGIRQNESVLDLARKFAEINAQQEKARLHSTWKQPVNYTKSGPIVSAKQGNENLFRNSKTTSPSSKNLDNRKNSQSNGVKEHQLRGQVPFFEKNSRNLPQRQQSVELKNGQNANRGVSSAETVIDRPLICNTESTARRPSKCAPLRNQNQSITIQSQSINPPRKKSIPHSGDQYQRRKSSTKSDRPPLTKNESTTVMLKMKPKESRERCETGDSRPRVTPTATRRPSRAKTMDAGQLKRLHNLAGFSVDDAVLPKGSVHKNQEDVVDLVKVELPENIEEAINNWKDLGDLPVKSAFEPKGVSIGRSKTFRDPIERPKEINNLRRPIVTRIGITEPPEEPRQLDNRRKSIDKGMRTAEGATFMANIKAKQEEKGEKSVTTGLGLRRPSASNTHRRSSRAMTGGIASLGDKPRMAPIAQNPWKQMPKGGAAVRPTNPNSIKEALLRWIQHKVQDYPIQITNFSSSWADGMAFCALIHRFAPNAFDYDKLDPKNRRENFELAFRVAEENGICPLLEVDDMIMMGDRPDWKCVFTYVQSFYKEFRNRP